MVGEEESHHAQFSLLAISLVLIAIALISFESHLCVQLGKPAVLISILAIALYALDHVLHALSLRCTRRMRSKHNFHIADKCV
jgi:hypothetical protein